MNDKKIPFPKFLRAKRLEAGLTQQSAAKLCKVCRQTWIAWEGGQYLPTKVKDIQSIATLTGLPPDTIYAMVRVALLKR